MRTERSRIEAEQGARGRGANNGKQIDSNVVKSQQLKSNGSL